MTNEKREKGLEIRVAIEDDIDDLIRLENACFETYYREHRFTQVEFRYYVQNDSAICLVAVASSSLVGYAAGVLKRSRCQVLATVDSIAVLTRFRRRGFGSRLLRDLIREAKRRSCEQISLVVAVRNEAGIKLFAKHGFKKLRTIPSYYGEGIDGFLMVSDIS